MDIATDSAYRILTNLNISINKGHNLKNSIDFTTDTLSKVLLCEGPNKATPIGAVKQNWFNKLFKRHVSKTFDLVKCSDKIKELYNSAKNMPNLIQGTNEKKFCRANLINISFNLNMILTTALNKYEAQLDNPSIFYNKKKLQNKISELNKNIKEIRESTPKLNPEEIQLALEEFKSCKLEPQLNKGLIFSHIEKRDYRSALKEKEIFENKILKATELLKLARLSVTDECSQTLLNDYAEANTTLINATTALEEIKTKLKKNPMSTSERLQNFANGFFKKY